jgi:DNA-binding beta-propeller fold protein YncE
MQTPVATAPVLVRSSSPLSIVPLENRLAAAINIDKHPLATPGMIGNHPDEIVHAGGFIWTKTANGHVVQVDPAANRIVAAIKVDTSTMLDHYCQGLGTGGEDVWACSASSDEDDSAIHVVRIDSQTQSIVETVKVDKIFDQFDMPFLSDQIWVLSGTGDQLIGIDVATNQAGPAMDLGIRCFQLATLEQVLLATCKVDNLVIKIDPEKREVIARQSLQAPHEIAAATNGIWVSQNNALTRLDPESLEPVATFPGITPGDIFATETTVWMWEFGTGVLHKIDTATNTVVEQIRPTMPFVSGGSMLVADDAIWLTANDDNLLLRLNLND